MFTKSLKALKNNQSGFTFVELLVVIVIMAVLVAASANYLFSQGGAKARDIERKNDMKQMAALLEQFTTSFGEPPNNKPVNRKIKGQERYAECRDVQNYEQLIKCFVSLKYIEGEGIENLALDPKNGISNSEGEEFMYKYGSDNNGWKLCAVLENQSDPDLNDNATGTGELGEEGKRTYCLISSNRQLSDIGSVDGGSIDTYLDSLQ